MAKGAAEAAVNQAAVDLTKAEQNSKPEDFAVRGGAAITKPVTNNGNPRKITSGELKDLLWFKGAEAK